MTPPHSQYGITNASPATEETRVRVAFASDHAGFELKCLLQKGLEEKGLDLLDVGAYTYDAADDYPDFAERIAEAFRREGIRRAVVVCGSGVGVCVALNKFPGIRAAVCHDTYSARQGVEHDDMNVLCLGSRIVGAELARSLVESFLAAQFSGDERHVRRLKKVLSIEKRNLRGG
jgi:ribose 5-phosphate isomerase B